MNSREPGQVPHLGSGRAARLRRRRRKRIALFASFVVIILLIVLAVVLLALEIADVSQKLKDQDTSEQNADTTDPLSDYVPASGTYNIHEGTLILVNQKNKYVFPADESRIIEMRSSRTINASGDPSYQCDYEKRLDKTALADFNKMMDAFYAATNNPYALVSDAYRNEKDQEGKSISVGHSDHHTGYLVSIKFYDDTGIYTPENPKYADAYAWLNSHAAGYGFVVRYPANKTLVTGVSDYTYCYRYVGPAHAAYMSTNDLCLEEYVELLRTSYVFGGNHLKITDVDGTNYEVYYIPATDGDNTAIYVPASSGGFEISGDNESGYIVTVTLK
ncbi:MAG: M15 family metallopeptidase [Eubacteriales bacterium]|jgi:D-alanyl-D-alanine carboxypeptidase